MNATDFQTRLHQDDPLFGTLIVSPAPEWLKAVKLLPLDYVFFDTEHIALDRAPLSWMCRAYAEAGLPAVVRIPSPDPYQACMVLDGGAAAVLAPYVETEEEVAALVGAVKRRPLKGEKLRRLLGGEAQPETLRQYMDRHNQSNSLLINIESVPALERLDRLLAVPGLDGVIVGPHDLSCSLGVPEQWSAPVFQEAVASIIRQTRARGLAVGVHVIYEGGLEHERRWLELGANLILHQADILAFRFAMARDLQALRQAQAEGSAAGAKQELMI